MSTFTRYNQFVEDLGKGVHDLGSDSLKYLLTNVAPDAATDAVLADTTDISAGNGYVAGGIPLTGVTFEQVSGVATLITDDKTLTASGGSIGPFRYVVLYNDTAASDNLIGYWDRGSNVTLADGDSLNLDADQTDGLFQVGT